MGNKPRRTFGKSEYIQLSWELCGDIISVERRENYVFTRKKLQKKILGLLFINTVIVFKESGKPLIINWTLPAY